MRRPPPGRRVVTRRDVRAIALKLPEAWESTSFGHAAFRVGSKLFVRYDDEPGAIIVRVDRDERTALSSIAPETFVVTERIRNFDMVLVRLATIERTRLETLLEDAWRLTAPMRVLRRIG